MKPRPSQQARTRQRPRGALALLWIAAALSALAFAQTAKMRLGPIAFFGVEELDMSKIKIALPVREGEEFSHESWDDAKKRLRQTIQHDMHICHGNQA